MRSICNANGTVDWVFDEYTHPLGLYYNKKTEDSESVAVAVEEKKEKTFFTKKKK